MSKIPEDMLSKGMTEEDADLWQRAMGSVKPLNKRRAAAPLTSPRKSKKISRLEVKACPSTNTNMPMPEPSLTQPPGNTPGVDRRTATRLRRGKLNVEARIDLHGYTQEQAHRALNGFIISSVDAGRRCVLVITGKGGRGGLGTGVIRAAVPHWLSVAPMVEHVLAINTARPQDGGEGALYVLLRRPRSMSRGAL
jgi:DNA-nicking Smr family endonuclease